MILKRLFNRRQGGLAAYDLYGALVDQARQPLFYLEFGVPDTVTGRFEMVMLHAYLVLGRLKSAGDEAARLSQQVFDVMFDDMDQSLREMGVGDLSVGKRIKKMASMFYGRVGVLEEGFSALERQGEEQEGGRTALEEAVARNVYPDADDGAALLATKLVDYLVTCRRDLSAQPLDDILAGRIRFPEPEAAAHD